MTQNIIIKENVVLVEYGVEFAVFARRPDDNGLQGITFSMPITPHDADLIESSGIVEVVGYKISGLISFRRRPFYETYLMAEVVIDILKKQHEKENS